MRKAAWRDVLLRTGCGQRLGWVFTEKGTICFVALKEKPVGQGEALPETA